MVLRKANMMVDVHFLTTNRKVFEHAKIESGAKYIPDWFKSLAPKIISKEVDGGVFYTMKTCPGFVTLFKKSFMIPLWSDINISLGEIGSNEASFKAPNPDVTMETHHPAQYDGFAGGEWQQIKFDCPWSVKSSKPLNFCFLEPIWNNIEETKNETIPATETNSMDWRTMGAVNPIKDQGRCATSYAFGPTAAIEAQVYLSTFNLDSLSE